MAKSEGILRDETGYKKSGDESGEGSNLDQELECLAHVDRARLAQAILPA